MAKPLARLTDRHGVELAEIFVYFAISAAANYLGYLALMLLIGYVSVKFPTVLDARSGQMVLLIIELTIAEAIPLLCASAYIKRCVPEQYAHSSTSSPRASFACFVLPTEVLRYLVSLYDLGWIQNTGKLTPVTCLLYERFYLLPTGSSYRYAILHEYTLADYASYSLIYALYAAIHVALSYLIYRKSWRKAESERELLAAYKREDSRHGEI